MENDLLKHGYHVNYNQEKYCGYKKYKIWQVSDNSHATTNGKKIKTCHDLLASKCKGKLPLSVFLVINDNP
jgi:hypothetical protein